MKFYKLKPSTYIYMDILYIYEDKSSKKDNIRYTRRSTYYSHVKQVSLENKVTELVETAQREDLERVSDHESYYEIGHGLRIAVVTCDCPH